MPTAIPKVVHLTPEFAVDHPYNLQLMESLRNLGVSIETVESKKFLFDVLKLKPDILHVHWLHPFTSTEREGSTWRSCTKSLVKFTAQLTVLRALGIKIVWTVHELRIPETHHPKIDNIAVRLMGMLSKAIITHCENARLEVLNAIPGNTGTQVKVVPCGRFVDVTENSVSQNDARKALNIPDSAFVILFFGLIRPYKGALDLIEAHARLDRDDIVLLLAGRILDYNKTTIQYAEAIKQAAYGKKNVRLINEYIPDDQIQLFMNASDVAAFPYRDVMTSAALIMAMGFGKACIASRLGCMSETLHEEGGFLYDADDENGLFHSLEQAISNREQLPKMGEYNRRCTEKLDWNLVAEKTLSVYRDCL